MIEALCRAEIFRIFCASVRDTNFSATFRSELVEAMLGVLASIDLPPDDIIAPDQAHLWRLLRIRMIAKP